MLVAVVGAEEKKKVTKLQIGVKKRVDDCTVKSRKGDMLHMHYTVSARPRTGTDLDKYTTGHTG
jgi:hypothetical protein